jgi:hypothetical protein
MVILEDGGQLIARQYPLPQDRFRDAAASLKNDLCFQAT